MAPRPRGTRDSHDCRSGTPGRPHHRRAESAVGYRGAADGSAVHRERRHHDGGETVGADDRPAAAGYQVDQGEVG